MYNLYFVWIPDVFRRSLVGIHFKWWWNDFGWLMFITKLETLENGEDIILGSNIRTNCRQLVRWYYRNAMRWLVVYPLDKKTLDFWKNQNNNYYKNLTISGWFYTLCDENPDSIYGQIIYKLNWQKLFELYAWRTYDSSTNKITDSNFRENFQKVQQDKILGLIYDTSFGVWFVGWKVKTKFEDLVNALNNSWVKDTITKIDFVKIENTVNADIEPIYWIQLSIKLWLIGLINISQSINLKLYKWFESILKVKRQSILYKTKLVDIWKVLNNYRKKIEYVCRSNWIYKDEFYSSDAGWVYCIRWDNMTIYIKGDLTNQNKQTDIIVVGKGNKVVIKKSQWWDWWLNIFLDNGYVMFDNNIDYDYLINGNWMIDYVNPVTSWAVYHGNIVVNWLLVWTDNGNNPTDFKHKLYIYGLFNSLNTLWDLPSREQYLRDLGLDPAYMDLFKVFSWDCLPNGKWTDWVNCSDSNDKYADKSIIVIKRNYPTIIDK